MKMHINKKISLILVCLVILAMLTACNTTSTNNSENEENKQSENKTEGNWELADEIVENVTNNQPEFADCSVDVEDFGGVYLDAALSDSDEDKVKEAIMILSSSLSTSKRFDEVVLECTDNAYFSKLLYTASECYIRFAVFCGANEQESKCREEMKQIILEENGANRSLVSNPAVFQFSFS